MSGETKTTNKFFSLSLSNKKKLFNFRKPNSGESMNKFGSYIREKREEQNSSMRDLAHLLNVSVPYISDIERGRRNPPQGESLQKIADFLHLDISELEVLIALDKKQVEIKFSEESPLAKVAIGLVRRQRTLSNEDASEILKILDKGFVHEQSSVAGAI